MSGTSAYVMTDAEEKYDSRTIKSRLQYRLWDVCEAITCGINSTERYTDAEIAAYAHGAKDLIDGLAENFELELWTGQITGALGERLRRLDAERPKSKQSRMATRALTNLVNEIRDARIAMVDYHQDCQWALCDRWRKKINTLERQGLTTEQWEDWQRVQTEARAYRDLWDRILSDGYSKWLKRHWELHPEKDPNRKAVAA